MRSRFAASLAYTWAQVRRLLEKVFPVRPGEAGLTSLLFLHSLSAVGAFVAGRSVRDALFLAHGHRSQLAWMYVASAAAVAAVGLLYNPIAARVRRDALALWSALLFAALFVGLFFAERAHAPSIYSVLYVYVEVMGALSMVQFWTLANELFNAREAKRLYGLIGSGGTLSNVLVGLLTGKLATRFGASSVLLLCAGLMVVCAIASASAGRIGRQRLFAKAASGKTSSARRTGGAARVLESPHLRAVAALAAITFFTTTLVDFEFKVIASDAFPKDQLTAYFGYFYAVVGVLALGMQLFGTSALLQRMGVIASLCVLPATLGFSSVALVLFPALWAASLAKGSDTLFRYSVNDATTQILYLPVPPANRAPAKAFIDGVIKPISIALAGVVLLGYRQWLGGSAYSLGWATLLLGLGWTGLVLSLRSHYIRSLQDNLRNRKLDLASARYRVQDGSTQKVLVRALESGEPREVLNALELLPHLESLNLDARVEALLDHPLVEIRIAALEYYGRRQVMRFANAVFRRFDDSDPRVRAAAVDAFCSMGRDKAVKSVKSFLADPHPAVRGAAVTGLIRFGGLDGVLMAAEALKALIAHPDPVMREHSAKILGDIGVKNFYQPVLELMNDPHPQVRRQAVLAAGLLKSPEFVIPLIYKTQSPDTGREAIEALAAYGGTIAPTLAKVIGNRHEDALVRRGVARVLGRIGTAEAAEVIAKHLEEPDEELRTRLYRSLARAVRGQRHLSVDRKGVETALDKELVRAALTLQSMELLKLGEGPGPKTPRSGPQAAEALLSSALSEKIVQTEQRMFLLLAILYPDAGMEHISAGIRDAQAHDASRKRANAVELLDNLLERSLRKRLLPLLEEGARKDRLRALGEAMELPPRGREGVIVALCKDETAWVRACAIFYAAQVECEGAAEAIVAASEDGSPVVREIALLSGAAFQPATFAPIAESHLDDEATVVRRRARAITGRA